jgi:hypothetical protein
MTENPILMRVNIVMSIGCLLSTNVSGTQAKENASMTVA